MTWTFVKDNGREIDWIIDNYNNVFSTRNQMNSNLFSIKKIPNIQWYILLTHVDNHVHLQLGKSSSSDFIVSPLEIKFSIGVETKKKIFIQITSEITEFNNIIEKNEVKNLLTPDNSLIINLSIKSPGENKFITPHKFFNNDALSDIVFKCDEREYPAHKVILSSVSSVFEKMFSTKENGTSIVKIENDEVFKELLRFIYTGEVENLNAISLELCELAYKYEIPDLRISCEVSLQNCLSVQNVISVLEFADSHKSMNLKKECLEYIDSHYEEVKETENFKNLNSQLLIDIIGDVRVKRPLQS